MVKKIVLVLALAALAAGGAFAQADFKISAGAGGYFTSDFGGGAEGSAGGMSMSMKMPYFGGGGFAFFDATFAELSVGFFGGGGTVKTEMTGSPNREQDMSYMGLDISLLGKYPFAINESLSVFPLLGATYRVMLSVKDEDGDEYEGMGSGSDGKPGDFSAIWFKLGGGLDYSFTDSIYLRGEALYGIRLKNAVEDDMVDQIPSAADPKALLGHGLEVKLAVGYRF